MNYKISDVRQRLICKQYAIGHHTRCRIQEDDIFNVAEIISHLAKHGKAEAGFSQKGRCWTFEGKFENQLYRLVVGPHQNNNNIVFIVTLFKVHPGIVKGQNYQKYRHRELVYTFNHAA